MGTYGKCTAGLPQIAGSVQVTEPRIIDKTGFDCENKLYYNPSSKAETIIFILKNGASLTNCYFKQSGESDAVHVEGNGNFKLSNLRFITIGDEAISIKGGGDVSIDHCVFVNGGNKAVQHDGTGSVTVNNSCFQYLHICMKSCGNCPQNVDKPRRTITSTSCSFYNVRTVMGCNINNGDVCTVSNPMGDSPSESICTTYDGISDSSRLPTQVSKNKRNPSCIF
ncbi:pectin lyase fold/virulence factor [Phakopsora pachyrhizi]|nr:pectin lyase fold/virulence factor [Phakopsora pachyrhizi]